MEFYTRKRRNNCITAMTQSEPTRSEDLKSVEDDERRLRRRVFYIDRCATAAFKSKQYKSLSDSAKLFSPIRMVCSTCYWRFSSKTTECVNWCKKILCICHLTS